MGNSFLKNIEKGKVHSFNTRYWVDCGWVLSVELRTGYVFAS